MNLSFDAVAFPYETDRLIIRPLIPQDFEGIYYLCSHPEISRYIRPPMTRHQVLERIEDRLWPWSVEVGRWISLAVILKDEPSLVGELVFRVESHDDCRLEIGYHFHDKVHGLGIAFEATSALLRYVFQVFPEAHKLVAYCESENVASRKLLLKLGFSLEGVRKEHQIKAGGWIDLCLYGMLRSEWSDPV